MLAAFLILVAFIAWLFIEAVRYVAIAIAVIIHTIRHLKDNPDAPPDPDR